MSVGGEVVRAAVDVRHLLWFRAATVRRRRSAAVGLLALATVTVAAALGPALMPVDPSVRSDAGRLLPAALAAVALVSIAGAVAGGGGRELLARDPAVVHPVSPVTDHLGALVLAPLNAGWLIQAWALLGLAASAAPAGRTGQAQLIVIAWLAATTTLGQAVGWAAERVRRGPHGVALVRLGTGAGLAGLAMAGAVPDWRPALVAGPARMTARRMLAGDTGTALETVGALAGAGVVLLVAGGWLATATARRPPLEEARHETRRHRPRSSPATDLAMLRRIDRASVWRSVPLRRGALLLAVAPGAVAAAGGMDWSMLALMPGLVASGCVLLFGVNLWCLDGRGLLWRESLPARSTTVVVARTWVLVELLLVAGASTLLLAALRAGVPTGAEVAASALALLVAVGQATSAGLRWSFLHPHAVDLRSPRATPAPPLAMVGYSVRLALTTTCTGMLFSGLAVAGRIDLMVGTAVLLGTASGVRIVRAARRWIDPRRRAEVVAVVAA